MIATGGSTASVRGVGWSVAKAQAYLVFEVRVPAKNLIANAEAGVAQQKMLGGTQGIGYRQAVANLRDAERGMTVDTAVCLGVTVSRGTGFTGFVCKLQLSDDSYMNLQGGYIYHLTAKARGTWRRNPVSKKWRWTTTSLIGPQ